MVDENTIPKHQGWPLGKWRSTGSIADRAVYNAWHKMLKRCYDPTNKSYSYYGGRGITVCERWRTSFQNFLADVGSKPSPAHSIDRYPDNDGNYEPGNVRWATKKQQSENRRGLALLTWNGRTQNATAWGREIGIPVSSLLQRLKAGWSLERALTTPPKAFVLTNITWKGESHTVAEWSRILGIPGDTLSYRLTAGWAIERAFTEPVNKRH